MKKKLNFFDLLVVAFGAMIGWGWVVSSGSWIQDGGVLGTVVGFLIAGIMIFLVGLVYSELTTAIPVTGGERVFSLRAFGPTGSFICTWALILSYIGVVCFEAVSLPTILQYIFPSIGNCVLYSIAGFEITLPWLLISIVFSVLIGLINIFGIKKAALLQKILTILIALVGLTLIISSFFSGNSSNLSSQLFTGGSAGEKISGILKVAVVAPFFLFGFDVIPQTSGEMNVPLKRIGIVMLSSIILAVLFYSGVTLAIGKIFNSGEIAESLSQSGLVTADAMAKSLNSQKASIILIIGGLCGILTSWNSFLIGGSRAIYSMSDANLIPGRFSCVHKKYDSPYLAIIFVTLITIISAFFGRTMLTWIVNSATFACSIAYLIVVISFMVLRKKEPNLERPFKIKHPIMIGILAAIMCVFIILLYIIPNTGASLCWQEWIIVGIWILLGLVFYSISKLSKKDRFGYSESDLKN